MSRTANRGDFDKLLEKRVEKIPASGLFGNDVDSLFVRSITEKERSKIASKILATNQNGMISIADERTHVLAASICDEKGNRLFLDDDAEFFEGCDSQAVEAIYSEIDSRFKVSLIRDESRTEELAKN